MVNIVYHIPFGVQTKGRIVTKLMVAPVKKRPKTNYSLLHMKAACNALERYIETGAREHMLKAVNHGVRFLHHTDSGVFSAAERFEFYETVKKQMALLTPKELMQLFPISKEFNGHKWQTKDYFFTMEEIGKIGADVPIGNQLDELLWDYLNPFVGEFLVESLCAATELYRQQTGVDAMAEFCKSKGVSAYHLGRGENGYEYLVDTETGESTPIFRSKPRKPKHINIVDGGLRCE